MERLTRCYWWEPFAMMIPAIIVLTIVVAMQGPLAWYQMIGTALGGYLFWSITEYTLHRHLFHFVSDNKFIQNQVRGIHGIHHEFPNDTDRLVIPSLFSSSLFLMFWGLHVAIFGLWWGTMFHVGFVVGYMSYDYTHYSVHHRKLLTPLGKAQKRRHMAHHYRYPEAYFSVTAMFWDDLFGTTAEGVKAKGAPGVPHGQWTIIDNDIV